MLVFTHAELAILAKFSAQNWVNIPLKKICFIQFTLFIFVRSFSLEKTLLFPRELRIETIKENDSIKLICPVIGDISDVFISWSKHKSYGSDEEYAQSYYAENRLEFVINKFRRDDVGFYSCKMRTERGNVGQIIAYLDIAEKH